MQRCDGSSWHLVKFIYNKRSRRVDSAGVLLAGVPIIAVNRGTALGGLVVAMAGVGFEHEISL